MPKFGKIECGVFGRGGGVLARVVLAIVDLSSKPNVATASEVSISSKILLAIADFLGKKRS